ncbi:MAG: aminotransferase class V-fold PLP-dependent enzyme [Blautia sp.]|nr:aminotransferase class V-fold PLP-dependent enzyme [Blautia sp.]MCM1202235.1 aminotransferase class V-fold PLP-dependent enzyme [Bacteroides fragilis]
MNHGKRQEIRPLCESLIDYGKKDYYPYHMPGHKRNGGIGELSDSFQIDKIDITEIDGFDNLHQPEGILREAQERAAALYGAEESFFLVNGSTCGILAAVSAAADRGDRILIARNCHKSVYYAAFLRELEVSYLYPGKIPEFDISDAVSPEDVRTALERFPECRAVVVTSPTYEGVIADIREIGRIVHEKDKILIVDEAHGAHLGLARNMPENAVRQGADLVIHSLHKTLPSMTQTALLHVGGSRVNRERLRLYLRIYQSSSPSYVLMASMDACLLAVKENAEADFARLERYYESFMRRMEACRNIRIGRPAAILRKGYCFRAWDICKLVISVKGTSMNGQALYDALRDEFHLQMEMAAASYVLAIMTIADEEEGWQRLADALLRIDGRIEEKAESPLWSVEQALPSAKMSIAQALNKVYGSRASDNVKEVALAQAAGSVSGGFVCLYPPGIPLLVPGEVIEAHMIGQIEESLGLGLCVQGVSAEGTVIIC